MTGLATKVAEAALKAAGVRVTVCVEHSDPAPSIVQLAAETGCDHIVMGTRSLGSLARMVAGSVATKFLHIADVPVTLVK